VHQYTGHTQAISNIVFVKEGSLFLTASLDQTVRLWSVSSFSHVYTFDFGLIPTRIWMTSAK